ncbi:MAG: sugar ABC transporter ATP-binding protein [Anaerolineales bacterium]|nr:sugar ABC transporter ATP-binding protein [Anaerolineales bacterium]
MRRIALNVQAGPVPLLETRGLSKAFPGVLALDKVDFEAYRGEVVALLGENGAGKSTLMKILSGAYRPDEGRILIDGAGVNPENPQHARDLGISIIYQEFNLTRNQAVWTNIFLGRELRRKGPLGAFNVADRRTMRAKTAELLRRVGARFSPDEVVRNLSVAEQQMVEIAKALSEDAKIIIMDEPTSALGEEEVAILFRIIRSLKAQNLAVIFITHRLEEVFRIANRIVVLRDGKRVGGMPVREATIGKVVSMMVGRDLDRKTVHRTRNGERNGRKAVLEVRNLSQKGALQDVSFVLRRGEILGVAGLIGAGRTELARAIFGADPIDAGEIRIDGRTVKVSSPSAAVKAGLALVPENRQQQGLVLIHSVQNNIALPRLDSLSRCGVVRTGEVRSLVGEFIRKLRIRTPGPLQRVVNLSGGNQQKVVLAKWLATAPKVLIMDEPTRGIDVGAKAEIYAIMDGLARQGVGIIMISSELPEVLTMSDRILAMREGRATGILKRSEATEEKIMALLSCGRTSQS